MKKRARCWFYTIVTSGNAFVAELQTGININHLLLSEAERISKQYPKKLREAVFRDEVTLEADSHDQRHGAMNTITPMLRAGLT